MMAARHDTRGPGAVENRRWSFRGDTREPNSSTGGMQHRAMVETPFNDGDCSAVIHPSPVAAGGARRRAGTCPASRGIFPIRSTTSQHSGRITGGDHPKVAANPLLEFRKPPRVEVGGERKGGRCIDTSGRPASVMAFARVAVQAFARRRPVVSLLRLTALHAHQVAWRSYACLRRGSTNNLAEVEA